MQYEVLEAAQLAIESLNGVLVDGSRVKVGQPETAKGGSAVPTARASHRLDLPARSVTQVVSAVAFSFLGIRRWGRRPGRDYHRGR